MSLGRCPAAEPSPSRPPGPRGIRSAPVRRAAARLLAAVLVLAAGLASFAPAPAQAQVELVQNTGVTNSTGDRSLRNDFAQAFTTGSNARGYTLTQVVLNMSAGSGSVPPFTVSIHE